MYGEQGVNGGCFHRLLDWGLLWLFLDGCFPYLLVWCYDYLTLWGEVADEYGGGVQVSDVEVYDFGVYVGGYVLGYFPDDLGLVVV